MERVTGQDLYEAGLKLRANGICQYTRLHDI